MTDQIPTDAKIDAVDMPVVAETHAPVPTAPTPPAAGSQQLRQPGRQWTYQAGTHGCPASLDETLDFMIMAMKRGKKFHVNEKTKPVAIPGDPLTEAVKTVLITQGEGFNPTAGNILSGYKTEQLLGAAHDHSVYFVFENVKPSMWRGHEVEDIEVIEEKAAEMPKPKRRRKKAEADAEAPEAVEVAEPAVRERKFERNPLKSINSNYYLLSLSTRGFIPDDRNVVEAGVGGCLHWDQIYIPQNLALALFKYRPEAVLKYWDNLSWYKGDQVYSKLQSRYVKPFEVAVENVTGVRFPDPTVKQEITAAPVEKTANLPAVITPAMELAAMHKNIPDPTGGKSVEQCANDLAWAITQSETDGLSVLNDFARDLGDLAGGIVAKISPLVMKASADLTVLDEDLRVLAEKDPPMIKKPIVLGGLEWRQAQYMDRDTFRQQQLDRVTRAQQMSSEFAAAAGNRYKELLGHEGIMSGVAAALQTAMNVLNHLTVYAEIAGNERVMDAIQKKTSRLAGHATVMDCGEEYLRRFANEANEDVHFYDQFRIGLNAVLLIHQAAVLEDNRAHRNAMRNNERNMPMIGAFVYVATPMIEAGEEKLAELTGKIGQIATERTKLRKGYGLEVIAKL